MMRRGGRSREDEEDIEKGKKGEDGEKTRIGGIGTSSRPLLLAPWIANAEELEVVLRDLTAIDHRVSMTWDGGMIAKTTRGN